MIGLTVNNAYVKLRVFLNFISENIMWQIFVTQNVITHYNYTEKQTLYFFLNMCESRFF